MVAAPEFGSLSHPACVLYLSLKLIPARRGPHARLVPGADAQGGALLRRSSRSTRRSWSPAPRRCAACSRAATRSSTIAAIDLRARERGRRNHAPGADRGAAHLHHAVRPHRHPGPDHLAGRRHRPDEQDRQDHHAVRGAQLRAADAADGRDHPAGVEAGAARRCRCSRSIGKNAGRLNALTEEIIRIEEQADQLHDEGRKALFLANRKHAQGNAMDFIDRHRALRSSREWWSTASRTSRTRSTRSSSISSDGRLAMDRGPQPAGPDRL